MDPFDGVDLSTLDDSVAENMNTMREAAESAETDDFDPQIDAASGAEADALQNGKIANKVLKLTGEVQVLNIKIAKAKAAGEDTSDLESSLADEQYVSFFQHFVLDAELMGVPFQDEADHEHRHRPAARWRGPEGCRVSCVVTSLVSWLVFPVDP